MNREIKFMAFVSHVDGGEFFNRLNQSISRDEFKGLEVEVQYSSCYSLEENTAVFSALLLGRVVGMEVFKIENSTAAE